MCLCDLGHLFARLIEQMFAYLLGSLTFLTLFNFSYTSIITHKTLKVKSYIGVSHVIRITGDVHDLPPYTGTHYIAPPYIGTPYVGRALWITCV